MRTCCAGMRRPVGRLTAGPKNGPGDAADDSVEQPRLAFSPEADNPVDVMRDASFKWCVGDALTVPTQSGCRLQFLRLGLPSRIATCISS